MSPHTFSPTHIYQYDVLGTGQPLDFFIQDDYYADNSGSLQVTMTPEPTTIIIWSLLGTLALIHSWWRRRKAA